MNQILIYLIFLILYIKFFKLKNYELYENNLISINPNSLNTNEDISIKINLQKLKDDINKMIQMIEAIHCKRDRKICNVDFETLFGRIEEELKLHDMVCILLETYVNEFIDIYITKRFNLKKYLNIKYQYPNDDHKELKSIFFVLERNIKFINETIDDENFFNIIYEKISGNLNDNLYILEELYETISSRNNFSLYDTNDIINKLNKRYIKNLLNNEDSLFNIKYLPDQKFKDIEEMSDSNVMSIYSLKLIKQEQVIDIIESIERMIENEINEIKNILNQSDN